MMQFDHIVILKNSETSAAKVTSYECVKSAWFHREAEMDNVRIQFK